MRFLKTLLFLVAVTHTAFSQKKITVKVTYIQPYCGGARPTPEMEAEGQKPRPYSKRTVMIVNENGKADTVKTDKEGNLKLKLKEGKYRLFESWRYYKKTPDASPMSRYDKDCLVKEWEKEFKMITVSKNKIIDEDKNPIVLNCEWFLPCILETNLPPRRQ